MKLRLSRDVLTRTSTSGELFVDGVRECYTLEDPVREGPKIPGNTAIPLGVYRVDVTPSERARQGGLWSPHPEHLLPILINVPEFTGIRIHAGNTSVDTIGCVLVGRVRLPDAIGASRAALAALMDKLLAARDQITISVEMAGEISGGSEDDDETRTLETLRQDEGRSLHLYYDTKGIPTIGDGINLREGRLPDEIARQITITSAAADAATLLRYREARAAVARVLPWAALLDPVRLAALHMLAYNMGIAGLVGKNPKMLAAMKASDYVTAKAELLDGPYKDDVGQRAYRIAEQIESGEWA